MKTLSALLLAPIAIQAIACTPAQFAELTNIEQVVLNDIVSGASRAQIETDVEGAMGMTGPIPAAVNIAINAAIDLLIVFGKIPPNFIPKARMLQVQEKAAIHAAGADAPESP